MIWNAKNGSVLVGNSEMSYVSFGKGARALILLPGLSDGLATVKGKALLLAASYTLFFKEFTVWMFSRKNELQEGCSIRDMAADQAEAMRLLGIEKACILGVSQGGMIAQYLAIDHPELVNRLILAVTTPRANELVQASVEKWITFARKGLHKELMIDTAEKSYSPAYLKKYRMIYPVIGLIGRQKSYDRFLANVEAILRFDATDELAKITCPTLIIGGQEDKIVGIRASRELKEKIPGSELYEYPGLGHAAYEEAKDFYPRVYEFLDEDDPTA